MPILSKKKNTIQTQRNYNKVHFTFQIFGLKQKNKKRFKDLIRLLRARIARRLPKKTVPSKSSLKKEKEHQNGKILTSLFVSQIPTLYAIDHSYFFY